MNLPAIKIAPREAVDRLLPRVRLTPLREARPLGDVSSWLVDFEATYGPGHRVFPDGWKQVLHWRIPDGYDWKKVKRDLAERAARAGIRFVYVLQVDRPLDIATRKLINLTNERLEQERRAGLKCG